MKFLSLKPADDGKHKFVATFQDNKHLTYQIKFGAINYHDFTTYYIENPNYALIRKELYIRRHKQKENWKDPKTAGFWSKNILWNQPTVQASLEDVKSKYFS